MTTHTNDLSLGNKFLDLTVRYLMEHEFDGCENYHLCAVLVSGGRVLSVGFNSRKSGEHGLQRRHKPHMQFVQSLHAEVDAVLNVRRKVDLNDAKIFVARKHRYLVDEKPSLAMSKPCMMCQAVLFSYGIRRAIYTIDSTNFGVMKVTDPRILIGH